MIKNCLFAVALASLALAGGCAKGGNGIVPPPPSIDVTISSPSGVNPGGIYPGQTVTLKATVSNSTSTAVTWSLSPSGAGTLTPVTPPTTPATATYVAPATVPTGSQPTITATLVSDTSVTGPLALTVVHITTDVSPSALSVGNGLTQTFTAVAVPDDAPQTFTWTCTENGVQCASARFHQDANVSGLAYYTAPVNCGSNCVRISAASTIDPTGCSATPNFCTIAKPSLVPYRINGTYAFQFSGYDLNNNATAVVGTFTAVNGAITGVEEELTSSGRAQHLIAGGSYTPTASDPNNSNNAGTLSLPTGVYPNRYQVVLDGAGDIAMIESDGQGTGSGTAEKTSTSIPITAQTFAFGFTGVDTIGHRVGYAGLIPMDGSGNVVGGSMDVNINGQSVNSICGAPPCTVAGSYTYDPISNRGQLTLTSPLNMVFDFFVASGTTSKTNPQTLYAITDPADTTNPAVSGTMVLQDSSLTYNNLAFKGTSVSALTGLNTTCAAPPCTNVSLTLGTTNGNGNFSGQFDQNNAGTILSSAQFPAASQSPSPYTYAASSSANGRYTFNMLGDPTKTTPVPPLPFVLYASGANRGFLLDQSSSSVMTGTMSPQGKGGGLLSGSELPGTFAAATTSSASSAVDPIAANLLFTWVNTGACTSECVSGTQYDAAHPAGVPLAGENPAYSLTTSGDGKIALTAPSTQNYVFYAIDTSGACTLSSPVCAVQDFLMIDVDTTATNPSIIFAQQ
ncbi:MAG: hypothetical protein ACXVZT_03815 [Terriglobales bacterium]